MDRHDREPTRIRLRTSNPGEARELLDGMYGSDLEVGAVDGADFRIAMNIVSAGGVTIADNDYRGELRFEIEGRDQFAFATMLSGIGEHSRAGRRFGPGDVYIGIAPGLQEGCHSARTHTRAVQMPAALLSQVASSDPDTPTSGWQFLSREAKPGAAAQWHRVVRAVERLLGDPRNVPGPLVVSAGIRLLAATALDVFPNTAVIRPDTTDAHDAHPDALRRAMAFIDADPAADISIADIARAAYVSTRALQLAFRRHLDTTPTDYLRRVRLSHAHDELADATRGDGTTVARVAVRWGFSNPSRFTAAYRAEYGQSPRLTLEGDIPPRDAPDTG